MNLPALYCRAAAAVGLAAALSFACLGCTTKKERAPGPLVIWLLSDPEGEIQLNAMMAEFRDRERVPIEVTYKDPFDMLVGLRDHREEVLGKVDVVELDVFDLEEMAPLMENLQPILTTLEVTQRFYLGAFESGRFDGRQCYIPFRLSWPVMVGRADLTSRMWNWGSVVSAGREYPGQVVLPALEEREFFALLCSMVWSYGGDPGKPDDPGVAKALGLLEKLREYVNIESQVVRSGYVATWPADKRPALFFEWPPGLVPMIVEGAFLNELKLMPIPCGSSRQCPVFAFGRFLAVPKGASHFDDALQFIRYMISPDAQRRLVFASPWLPVRTDGWGDLAAREEEYRPLIERADGIKPPPHNLKKVQKALVRAANMVLFEGADADAALAEYQDILVSD